MPIDPGQIRVERVIIHDVPRSRDPWLSDIESQLDQELRTFIEEKLKRSIVRRGLAVTVIAAHPGDTPRCLADYFADPSNHFVPVSHRLARELSSAESRVNASEGLLAVVATQIGELPGLGIVKLEKEEGVNFRLERVNGLNTVNLEMLRTLMFTNRTEVYKIGHFAPGENETSGLQGHVADLQAEGVSKRGVAEYWIGSFLGCDYVGDPPVQTRNFFKVLMEFIDKQVDDEQRKVDYTVAAQATMRNNNDTFRPMEVASTYLHGEDRQRFHDFLSEREINPTSVIRRDTSLIDTMLRQMTLGLDTGIKLSGPAEAIRDHVRQETDADGNSIYIVDGDVQTVRPT